VTVQSGGIVDLEIYQGGSISGFIVSSGRGAGVGSGGFIDGATINGGELELGSGSNVGSGSITFKHGGTLRLDQSTAFNGLVAGFGKSDELFLRDIAFGAGTSASFVEASSLMSGTLTVTDGTNTANITLLGQFMTGDFNLRHVKFGGTLVTTAPAGAASDSPIGLVTWNHT
jgi:hypothetical protein